MKLEIQSNSNDVKEMEGFLRHMKTALKKKISGGRYRSGMFEVRWTATAKIQTFDSKENE